MERVSGTNSVHDLIGMFEGWEKVQELAEHLSGVRAQLIDPQGKTISGRESLPAFCRLIQSSKIGDSRCRKCYETNALSPAAVKRQSTVFQCHAGLENVVFPISIDGIPAGAIACGRALNPHSRPDERQFQALANELSIDFRDMDEAVGKLSAIESSDMAAFAKLLKPFVDALGETIFRYFTLIEKSEDLIVAAKESDTMMSVDRLTGLFNRRYFDTRIESEVSRTNRYNHSISLVLLEVDSFSDKVDSYGLIAEDIITKEIATVLLNTARQTEVVVRFDEDRFGVIMPECDHEQAYRFAERVRKAIAVHSFGKDAGLDITLSMSIGVAALREEATVEKLVERAEQVLSQAKNDGGNKIRLAPTPGGVPEPGKTPHVYIPNHSKKRRVVVTGLGPIAPNGIGKDAFWNSLKNGVSGIKTIESFDTSEVPVKFAGEIRDFEPSNYTHPKNARRLDRFALFSVGAARIALNDSGLSLERADKSRIGVSTGTAFGGFTYAAKELRRAQEFGQMKVSPYLPSAMLFGSSSSEISIELGLTGPSTTYSTGCNSSADAIAYGCQRIMSGEEDIFLAGGADAPLMPTVLAGFSVTRALSVNNANPEEASRPFDRNRDGFVLSEGAGFLVLEELEYALKRGAKIYGEILGYGVTCDAYHMTRPDPDGIGMISAMNRALNAAQMKATDLQHVNAHGTSTPLNDSTETKAIRSVFEEHASKITVVSTKSMIGHSMGAPSALELIATLMAMENEFVPPTINYKDPDPDCDLDYVPNTGRRQEIDFAMSNSFSFGGKNSAFVIGKNVEKN